MSSPYPSQKLKNILIRNRASLGLIVENENFDVSNLSSQNISEENNLDSLSSLLDNLSLDLNLPNSNIKMENLRFHTSLLPTFSGTQNHLESFIISIDEFYQLYFTNNGIEQNKVVLAAIKSKLIDSARDFLLSRPDLDSWPSIKEALRQKFGNPISY